MDTGGGEGIMTTANHPMPPYAGDNEFQQGMQEFILPSLDRFEPEMVLVSYGFDPHFADPLGNLQLTSKGYGVLIHQLVDWVDRYCQGRIALFLEGGYDLQAAKACSLGVTAALLGEQFPDRYDQQMRQDLDGESDVFTSILQQAKQLWELE